MFGLFCNNYPLPNGCNFAGVEMATKREEQFEAMLSEILSEYKSVSNKMEALKAEGKEKSVTFKQLFARKLSLQDVLIIYKNHGLIEDF